MSYVAMPRTRLSDGVLSLRAVESADVEPIRAWRNSQMDVLRQERVIAPQEQLEYFERHVWPEMERANPGQILLGIERGGELIGYGGLVHVSWSNLRAEISFLLSPELESDVDGRAETFARFLRLSQELAFGDLGLRRLFTETFAHRLRHIETLEACGFRREGCMREHVRIGDAAEDSLIHGILAVDWRKM